MLKEKIKLISKIFLFWWLVGFAAEPKLEILKYSVNVFVFSLIFYIYYLMVSKPKGALKKNELEL